VRLTIERMRAMVLVGAGLLIAAVVVFLGMARWKARSFIKEIPQRLGANIQQEANGVTYTQAHGGHTLFKIHASKVVQLKEGGRAILHDVQIELYGEDGSRVDRIAGQEFEYDQKNGIAKAGGPVEITLMRPGEAPAVAPKAIPERGSKSSPLANAAKAASKSEIHVKTSGLIFDQKSGMAFTDERVEFAVAQGTGSSVGAVFDSGNGQLVLDHAVELDVQRGPEKVLLRARHAEFERDTLLCRMDGAEGSFRGGQATAGAPISCSAMTGRRCGWMPPMAFRSQRLPPPALPRRAESWNLTSTTSRAMDVWKAAPRWTRRAKAARCTVRRPRLI